MGSLMRRAGHAAGVAATVWISSGVGRVGGLAIISLAGAVLVLIIGLALTGTLAGQDRREAAQNVLAIILGRTPPHTTNRR
jgi:hypothetical protein